METKLATMMSTVNAEDNVWQCLGKAIDRFNRSAEPQSLLCPRDAGANKNSLEWAAASERAITHRLAFYIECELRSVCVVGDSSRIVVDCEYNRHIGSTKSLAALAEEDIKEIVKKARKRELEANDDGFYVFSVAPDIVVHERLTDDNNHLVVEVKKASSRETEKYDELKLALFTKPKQDKTGYGYKFGAWVVAEDKCDPETRKLRIVEKYKDGIAIPIV
jgi:hypothetical protein